MKYLILVVLLLMSACTSVGEEMSPNVESSIIKSLQEGGYVIYFRHASTEKDYADQVLAQMGNCSTQRSLSEAGWNEAKAIGAAFTQFQIPVEKVYSRQYCRAWQTADLAFGTYEKSAKLNFLPTEEFTDAQMQKMKENVRPFLTKIPEPGKNLVIVGHDDVFESATGIYPEPQGVGYILKPSGDTFEIVDHVLPNAWSEFK